jgi:virginiamycin B lyase
MTKYVRFGSLVSLIVALTVIASACYGATITGTVKGSDGSPAKSIFVQAQNTKTKITTYVMSDAQGHYKIEKLVAGDYRVQARATGLRSDPKSGVALTADQNASVDFALETTPVRWSDISIYQGKELLPAATGKDTLLTNCMTCHGFQARMAAVHRDADGWKDRVDYMRNIVHFSLANSGKFGDTQAADLAGYLTSVFGPDSILPKSPENMPAYKATLRPLSNPTTDIVYVEYDLPGMNRLPFSAVPDKNGNIWIPNFGPANNITRLDPKTGEYKDFKVGNPTHAAIHSAYPAPDGSVWLGEQASNKIGKWDPTTQEITEYQDAYLPGKEGITNGGCKHTIRFDPDGNVWSSGDPLSRYNPKTGKFTDFWNEVGSTYTVAEDANGNIWFTTLRSHQIGMIDYKTLKVKIWDPPTKNSFPRRLEIDTDGTVWFAEYNAGKITRFDRETETFKEYQLPGQSPTPYALGIDKDHNLWYSSYQLDVVGRLDPKTGKVVEYPFPHAENTMRELFRDPEGRMWYGSPANGKVGYFYVASAGAGTHGGN